MEVGGWDELRILLAVARGGTLTRAADSLGIDQTTVSRKLKALQGRTHRELFDRLRGGVTFTEAGEAMVAAAESMEAAVLELERLEIGKEASLKGQLRLTVTELLAQIWMPDLMAFARKYPQVQFQVDASNELQSLARREADVALRFVESPAEHLIGRRLGGLAMCAYATSEWATVPLNKVPWIGWDQDKVRTSVTEEWRQKTGGAPYAVFANSYLLLLEAARRGAGAVLLPCLTGDRTPELVRLMEPVVSVQRLWVLTHEDTRNSARVKALMKHIAEFVQRDSAALLGELRPGGR